MRIRFYKLAAVLSMCVLLAGCRDKGPSEVELARNEGISYMEQADYQNAITAFENAYNLCDEKMPETKTDISLYEAACQFKTADFEGVKTPAAGFWSLGKTQTLIICAAQPF